MRLLDAEDLSSLRLGKFPLFDDAVYLQRQACLKKLLVRIGETKVLKNVTATFFNFDLGLSLGHIISAFPYGAVQPLPTDGRLNRYPFVAWQHLSSTFSEKRARRRSHLESAPSAIGIGVVQCHNLLYRTSSETLQYFDRRIVFTALRRIKCLPHLASNRLRESFQVLPRRSHPPNRSWQRILHLYNYTNIRIIKVA